jgi:hypothetical protein
MRHHQVIVVKLLVNFLDREVREVAILIRKVSQVKIVPTYLKVCP